MWFELYATDLIGFGSFAVACAAFAYLALRKRP
jgi:hypothetical protein